jgi:hypothetical protein
MRTLRTESAKNNLAITNYALAKGSRRRLWHVVPVHILDAAASVADKVVVPHAFGIEPPGAPFDSHFANQSRLYQISQIVISRRSRRTRIDTIHCLEDFSRRGMADVIHQKCHHSVPLCSAAEAVVFQGLLNLVGIHGTI